MDYEIVRKYKETYIALKDGKYALFTKDGQAVTGFKFKAIVPSEASDSFVLINQKGMVQTLKYQDIVKEDTVQI